MPAALPEEESVSMRVRVDLDLCQGHGVCEQEAPEVFRVVESPDGTYSQVTILLEEPPEELRPKVTAAARYCPNRVIEILEDA